MSSSLKNKKDSIMTQSSMGAQSVEPTFYWYDYETFGVDPRKDRPAQFAGRRTRLDLSPLSDDTGEIFYCRPMDDQLPNPESCLLTGITPQCCAEKGVCESEFADLIWERLNTPGTVSIGYNTLGFDDEVNRFLFWRNFLDPYTHSWAKGCSRWDLFPVVCAAWALRGDTIKWPRWEEIDPIKYPKAEGRKGVCFKLEFLTKANGIEHGHAHDALSDVEATIGMAKLLAEREPKLWRWAFENRTTAKVSAAVADMKPVVWVTPKFGIARGCTGIAACFFQEKHDCWMWDLSFDPTVLQSLSYEEIKQRLFPSIKERAQGIERLPIRRLKANASPFVCANLKVLSRERAQKYGIDLDVVAANLQKLRTVAPAVQTIFAELAAERRSNDVAAPSVDPDQSLYSGFASSGDKARFVQIRSMTPERLAAEAPKFRFDDQKFAEMLFRFRARNWPEMLSAEETERWRQFCADRVMSGRDGMLQLSDYFDQIDEAQASGLYDDERHQQVLETLYDWGETLGNRLID